MHANIPTALPGERPANYADRLGQWYAASVTPVHKKAYGQYYTPVQVADFMARMFESASDEIRILDPGAGAGVLSCALCEHLASREKKPSQLTIEAYETDYDLARILESSLQYLRSQLAARGVRVEFFARNEDFVIKYAAALDDFPKLFSSSEEEARFDMVISNPPYFKLSKSDPRARAASVVVHGQPNIYAFFMAVSAALLLPGGEFVSITPRSFASGPYFRLFRERFFDKVQPEYLHVFESRTDAFKRDEVLQENVILKARRTGKRAAKWGDADVRVSSSKGVADIDDVGCRKVRLSRILDPRSRDKVLRIPVSEEEERLSGIIRSWSGSLESYGLEISTGPVVPFRAAELLSRTGEVPRTHAPLLWMQNIRPMSVEWPTFVRKKQQYFKLTHSGKRLLVPDRTYVLLRRFSAKEERRRLTAAPLVAGCLSSPWIALENHLNYIHKPGGTLDDDEAWGLAALYNSLFLDTYFRTINGNTQVSATELRDLPLPAREVIVEIGRKIKVLKNPGREAESLVASSFEALDHLAKRGRMAVIG